ncbi:chromate transporter [Paracoccus tibetensis]|uniref:Chromate transporter n=1 Tax=Paracoccus tibetensis TaxID=336292 RepID=A0A1G5K4F9_9RHOB|nr:chromate transporter [Paracoccus tibetensis]
MQGANAVLGLLDAVLYSPIFVSAVGNMRNFTLALTCVVALVAWKASPWLVVLLTPIRGIVLMLL